MSLAPRVPLVDRFERGVILRTSRGMFLLIALGATVGLAGGAAAITYTFTPTVRGADPAPPPVPAPPEVTLSDVMSVLDVPEPEDGGGDPEGTEPSYEAAELTPMADADGIQATEFTQLADQLKSYFDATKYPWLSETRAVCTYPNYYGGCARWETRTLRKGVVDVVSEAIERAKPDQRAAMLRALVELMPLCADEDTRFLAVGAVIDVVSAAGSVRGEQVAALRALLTEPLPPGTPAPAPGAAPTVPPVMTAAVAQDLLNGVLRIRKRGAEPRLLVAWLGAARDLHALFDADAEGQSNRVDGLVATWQALQGTLPELASQRIAGIQAIAAGAPGPARPQVVRTYGDLVRARTTAAQKDYQRALAQRQEAIAELDAAAAAGEAKKAELRVGATSVVGAAFAAMASVGLLLALLAVERNTRALRDVLLRLESRPPLDGAAGK